MDDRPTITPPAKGAPTTPTDASREARRAEALRANLRRRKAALKSATAGEGQA
jgi:hypothetical protein